MPRISRTQLDEPTLSHRLQWHAGQSLRRGIRCSVIVLQPMALETRAEEAAGGQTGNENPLEEVARRLRAILRHTDVVEVDPAFGIGVLLPDADEAGTAAVHGRIVRELGQRPSARARRGTIEDVRFAVGRASAAPNEAAQLPAVVRDLVCIASSPDLWMCVPVVRPTHRAGGRRGMHPLRGHAGSSSSSGSPRTRQARRVDLRVLAPELSAASVSHQSEELRRLADRLGVPFVCVPSELPAALRRLLPADLARALGAVPIGRTRGVLTVAMRDPSDLCALQQLAAATGLTIFPVLAAPDDLDRALAALDAPASLPRHTVLVPSR